MLLGVTLLMMLLKSSLITELYAHIIEGSLLFQAKSKSAVEKMNRYLLRTKF